MIGYRPGDVVLVEFVFSDETGTKLPPAVIISTDLYRRSRQEVIISAVTSNVRRRLVGDQPIDEWQAAGLLAPAVATGIIRTIKDAMIKRRLGSLSDTNLRACCQALRQALTCF
jgi:mRNA interferase MazF